MLRAGLCLAAAEAELLSGAKKKNEKAKTWATKAEKIACGTSAKERVEKRAKAFHELIDQ